MPALAAAPIIDIDVEVAGEARNPFVIDPIESTDFRLMGGLDVSVRGHFEAPPSAHRPEHVYLVENNRALRPMDVSRQVS